MIIKLFNLQYKNKITVNKEFILQDQQKIFLDNIESYNYRNNINEYFNNTKRLFINFLNNSEIDKIYKALLHKISLKTYKRITKTDLREYKIFYQALEKQQYQKKLKFQLRVLQRQVSKYENSIKKIIDDYVNEISLTQIYVAQKKKIMFIIQKHLLKLQKYLLQSLQQQEIWFYFIFMS
ncbi:unnamed protein product [Paramecium pentaurelia]|uniref:Uncharacterized protein n=1 Tax=Paramecium pentaurelia TaxID=43138 RepID=A0A8S1YN83_9CILI|nr:unnamed protein product [Paramecium pentaurelia]